MVALVLRVLWNLKGMIRLWCRVQTSWWRDRYGVGAQVLSPVRLVVVVKEDTSVVDDSLGAVKCGHDVDRGIYEAVRLTEYGGAVVVVVVVDGIVLSGQRQRTCPDFGSTFSLLFCFRVQRFVTKEKKKSNVFATRLDQNKGRDGLVMWVYYEEGNNVNGLVGGSTRRGPQEVIDEIGRAHV